MELGEKLRQARLEAGLTQRQLCGDEITRNMLSLIENGSARPSMKTLQYLSAKLGKSVSFFLEETGSVSPNYARMLTLRQQFDAADYTAAAQILEQYQSPDAIFDREKALLQALTYLELARQAIAEKRNLYALELLAKAEVPQAYCADSIRRQRLLLLGQLPGQRISSQLPSLDAELLLRAQDALAGEQPQRAARLLDAAEDPKTPHWNLLRGECYLQQQRYCEAARCFHQAEADFPRETVPKLEQCYRELGDYKQAYTYACKQR